MRFKKGKNKIAVVTVIYKKGLPFFKDYFTSLDKQKMKEFDLLLFNSDIGEKSLRSIEIYLDTKLSLKYKIIHLRKHSISLLWTKIIRFLLNSDYSKFVFADFDDYFSPERVSVLNYWLEKEPLVFHDLNLFFDKGGKIVRNYFTRLVPSVIDWKFILDKNCVGFTNSAIRRQVLFPLKIPKKIKVVDWYFFANIMLRRKIKGRFVPWGLTFYRQYFGNSASLINLNKSKIEFALRVKYLQYKSLLKNFRNSLLKEKYNSVAKIINSDDVELYLNKMLGKYGNKRMLWWEGAQV